MAIFTMKDLDKEFTNTINDYVNKGYIISPMTHGGSYSSEKSHVDFINPKDNKNIFRVWLLEDEYTPNPKRAWDRISTLVISIRKYKWDGKHYNCTLWPDKGEVISEKAFYTVKHCQCYTDSLEEALSFRNLSCSRFEARHIKRTDPKILDTTKMPLKTLDAIMDKINCIRGFRRANLNCIKKVTLSKDYNGKLRAYIDYDYNNKSGRLIFS